MSEDEWKETLIDEAKKVVGNHAFWKDRLASQESQIHLAVLIEPYLRYILNGKKTVESRFSVNRCAPYQQVSQGDILLLKRSGGPVIGICEVSRVWDYELEAASWKEIRKYFAKALCAQDPSFWKDREAASFATLMQIQNVAAIEPILCKKRDRRGWVVLTPNRRQLSLEAVNA